MWYFCRLTRNYSCIRNHHLIRETVRQAAIPSVKEKIVAAVIKSLTDRQTGVVMVPKVTVHVNRMAVGVVVVASRRKVAIISLPGLGLRATMTVHHVVRASGQVAARPGVSAAAGRTHVRFASAIAEARREMRQHALSKSHSTIVIMPVVMRQNAHTRKDHQVNSKTVKNAHQVSATGVNREPEGVSHLTERSHAANQGTVLIVKDLFRTGDLIAVMEGSKNLTLADRTADPVRVGRQDGLKAGTERPSALIPEGQTVPAAGVVIAMRREASAHTAHGAKAAAKTVRAKNFLNPEGVTIKEVTNQSVHLHQGLKSLIVTAQNQEKHQPIFTRKRNIPIPRQKTDIWRMMAVNGK
jgi:hypothetical protein